MVQAFSVTVWEKSQEAQSKRDAHHCSKAASLVPQKETIFSLTGEKITTGYESPFIFFKS